MRRVLIAPLLALVLGACGSHPPTSPSTTTPPPTGGSGSAPTVAINVKADAAGSRDAVASLSEVIVDASGSTGTGLTFAIDFGDGATATTATAKHAYATPSTYTVTATVTDAQGRKASDTRQIAVRDATGNWFQAGYVAKTKRVEVRRLNIDAQTGTTVRGSYRVTGDVDRPFTGTLTAPRDIHMTAGSVSLEGTLPGRLNDEATIWTLLAHGDSADGQRLDFRAITSAPEGPPPDADLRLSFDTDDPDAWGAWAALTPVRLDGSRSRGTDLVYFLDYGNGVVVTSAVASRTIDPAPLDGNFFNARLTVVDRFGRSDVESQQYFVAELSLRFDYWIGYAPGPLIVRFSKRQGTTYSGLASTTDVAVNDGVAATATMSGTRDVRISVPAWGAEFQGRITMSAGFNAVMTVVESGSRFNGRTWGLRRTSDF